MFIRLPYSEKFADHFHELGVETVLLKLGKEGSLISAPSVLKTYVPGFYVERVVDPIGAGDALHPVYFRTV
ncbi:hypothetical protein KEH51_23750 [[Brevibacterium] frigoritolerans]|uniref:Carbohydrate kinase PfkB domain-containing protein n=1 Tax=Peribacillus frigoritolerans TaxID=450367 RepID=A0A941FJK0_9BACI|nr:hypothetical protein [Peribacillus frigoritolerans]